MLPSPSCERSARVFLQVVALPAKTPLFVTNAHIRDILIVGGSPMMYEYLTFDDETLVTHSEIRNKDGENYIDVYFEKPVEGGFHSANCQLPSYKWTMNDGYSESEISFFTTWLEHNAATIFKYAACGGLQIA